LLHGLFIGAAIGTMFTYANEFWVTLIGDGNQARLHEVQFRQQGQVAKPTTRRNLARKEGKRGDGMSARGRDHA